VLLEKMVKVAVIGAGVIGLSTAYILKSENPSIDVQILTKSTSPNTCTDVAAGLWEPFVMRNTPAELQRKWSKITWDYIEELKTRNDAKDVSILTLPAYNIEDKENVQLPPWKDVVPDMRALTKEEMKMFPDKYKSGFVFTTYILEPSKYMKWLMKKYIEAGGSLHYKKVNSFDSLADTYDVVVNCTGFYARDLCNDATVEPVRGQVMRVKAPWINRIVLATFGDKVAYIIPNSETVVLGGTVQLGNFNGEISEEDKAHILRETALIDPNLENMVHVLDAVDFRPSRPAVRLEKEDIQITSWSSKSRVLKVIY